MSVRLKLALSYAGFLMIAGAAISAIVWFIFVRELPNVSVLPGGTILDRSELSRNLAMTAGVVIVFLMIFGLVGGWFLAAWMSVPLQRITNATRQATKGSLSHRINLEGRQDEFRELADSFDVMLAKLETQVAAQQRFTANASHELRTPLAVTQTMLEVARADPERDADQLIERLQIVNNRAVGLTEALLVLTRADGRSFAKEAVDLSLIAEDAAETLLPLAEKHDVTIVVSADTAPTLGSPALLLQMATNILHNAIIHNLPDRGTVWAATTVSPKGATLTVENTGDVLSPALVGTLTEPFKRGTERILADQAGIGLGLAIVKSIVDAHEGTLTLTARTDGGLCVVVALP